MGRGDEPSEKIEQSGGEDGEAGFTLLELLIAMTLLGLLMVVLFGGLRFGARVWERTDRQSAGVEEVGLAQALIRREIEGAYPYFNVSDPLHPHVEFDGAPHSLGFLGPTPLAVAPAGRARIVFAERTDGSGTRLFVSTRPELAKDGDRRRDVQEVLIDNIESVRFSYFGRGVPGDEAAWHDRWSQKLRPPSLVRITLTFKPGDRRLWPEMIVAPRIAVDVGCLYDPLTKYCQGR